MKNSKRFLKTVIIYIRVSSKETLNSYSLDTQEKACTDYALEKGYRVLEVFREQIGSGKSFNRPQLQAMIEYCKLNRGKVKFIMVSNINRLSTDKSGLSRLRFFFKRNGITLFSIADSMIKYVEKQSKTGATFQNIDKEA